MEKCACRTHLVVVEETFVFTGALHHRNWTVHDGVCLQGNLFMETG
jgi:hypothetical protein